MNFVGLHMLVTLKDPPGAQLRGTVSEITPGERLVLSNVFSVGTDKWVPRLSIDPGNILDVKENRETAAPKTFAGPAASPIPAPVDHTPAPKPAFTDPAIVSLGKRPSNSTMRQKPQTQTQTQTQTSDYTTGPKPAMPGILPAPSTLGYSPSTQTTDINQSLHAIKITDHPNHTAPGGRNGEQAANPQPQSAKKKNRKPKTQRGPKTGDAEEEAPAAYTNQARGGQNSHGKGWRQTPILQTTPSFQPFKSLKRNGKKNLADNGWASEEVTEGLAEFDFESGLAKFDKRAIFDQMKKEDLVDDADRLVSHNRKAKPGTAGGKNFHHSEMVLDMPSVKPKLSKDFWNSEADDAVEATERLSGRDVRSSQSMRRGESKSGTTRRSQSRKASASGGPAPSRANPGQTSQPGFYLSPSGRRAETVSALQMLNLENIAANEVGLTEDMMTENAGRGIAEVTVRVLADPAIQLRLGSGGVNIPSTNPIAASATTVVILAGNNKSGIRAVAAARHLRNRGIHILICVVGSERERDLLEDMRQQIRIFKNFGGRILSKIELFEQLRKSSNASGPPVALIIDALLGLAISFEELRTGDQATVYELIEWANRNEAFTLAVDVPTGIDPSTGKVSIIDGGRLYVKPRYVVAMGAPKRGLLEAVAPSPREPHEEDDLHASSTVAADEDEWRFFIADIGLGAAVWRKAGTKLRRGIDFDDQWVHEMRYQGTAAEEEPDY